MKIKQLVWTAAAVLALSNTVSASAITWVDRDPDSGNGPLQFLSENGTTVFSSTFDITPAGFIPGTHLVDTINVKFAFSDDNSDSQSEYVDIFVGGFNIWNDLEVDGTHANAPTSYEWFSQGLTGNISILNLRVCQHFALGWHFTGILPARRREVDLPCSGGKPGWDFGQSHDSCPKLAPVQRTRPHWTTKKAGWRWARGVRS